MDPSPATKPFMAVYMVSPSPTASPPDLPHQRFPPTMPLWASNGLSLSGILAIESTFHQTVMDCFSSVVKENPTSLTDEDLPTTLWVDTLLKQLREDFLLSMVV